MPVSQCPVIYTTQVISVDFVSRPTVREMFRNHCLSFYFVELIKSDEKLTDEYPKSIECSRHLQIKATLPLEKVYGVPYHLEL